MKVLATCTADNASRAAALERKWDSRDFFVLSDTNGLVIRETIVDDGRVDVVAIQALDISFNCGELKDRYAIDARVIKVLAEGNLVLRQGSSLYTH